MQRGTAQSRASRMLRIALIIVSAAPIGCAPKRQAAPSAATRPSGSSISDALNTDIARIAQADALPKPLDSEAQRERIVEGLRLRIARHRDIERDLARVLNTVEPLVEEAVRLPEVQDDLSRYAADSGLDIEAARARWRDLQTADILLESGGDPDALSSANAAGVAQWLADTTRAAGLHVEAGSSTALTRRINALRCTLAWIDYLARPDADANAPGAPALTPEDRRSAPALRSGLESLRSARRAIDPRYDPASAIQAQTRYLLHLYRRFPSEQWLFQAYHGGEAGATKTLRLFLGPAWPGSAEAAIRGANSGTPLSYERLYFETTPTQRPEAFAYLYGRSDDHRHYWYKIVAAQRLLAEYRNSPSHFHTRWAAGIPGRTMEALWYPNAESAAIHTLEELRTAIVTNRLMSVPAIPNMAARPPRDDAANAALYAALRPEALGALRYVVARFRQAGGRETLQAGDMTVTTEYSDRARRLHPGKPAKPPIFPPDPEADLRIGGGPSRRFDHHTTGLTFDLLRPVEARQRATLAYTLDQLEAEGVIDSIEAKDQDQPRFHIAPAPGYARLFARTAADSK